MKKKDNKALADACAGVVASLVSLWVFYPFEILKLNAQTASTSTAKNRTITSSTKSETVKRNGDNWTMLTGKFWTIYLDRKPFPQSPRDALLLLIGSKRQPIRQALMSLRLLQNRVHAWLMRHRWLLAGLPSKSLHTASSSFCYFYLYSWIISAYRKRLQQQQHKINHSNTDFRNVPAPTTRLFLAATAAAINTCLTLPMDVISTHHQLVHGVCSNNGIHGTASDDLLLRRCDASEDNSSGTEAYIFYDASHSSQENDDTDTHIKFDNSYDYDPRFLSMEIVHADNDPDIEQGDGESADDDNEDGNANSDENIPFVSVPSSFQIMHQQWSVWVVNTSRSSTNAQWRSLWKGLVPALLLCWNPAIHFSVYDICKSWYLSRRCASRRKLGLTESFLLGMLAKFVATVATYPLIQAKVKLMTTTTTSRSNIDSGRGSEARPRKTLWSCLHHEYETNGMAGLYRGCDIQLLHTLLKSALLMMLRERIEQTTRRWLVHDKDDDALLHSS